ncbi:YeeE/YedE family protein [bacterium]|nr:YeeE/YedE family protein [bacterium]
MHKPLFLICGTAFGFILSRAGATTYDFYAKLFLFQDFQLLWVILFAVAMAATGKAAMRLFKVKSLTTGRPLSFVKKPFTHGIIPGSLLFGLGWGLVGACPGTVLAMLGEGKLSAAFTIFGILLGTFLYGIQKSRMVPKTAVLSDIKPEQS